MKTKEELNALKEEVEIVCGRRHELTEEELEQVSGGAYIKDKSGQSAVDACIDDKSGQSTGGTYTGSLTDQYAISTYIVSGYSKDYSARSH